MFGRAFSEPAIVSSEKAPPDPPRLTENWSLTNRAEWPDLEVKVTAGAHSY